MAHGSDIGDPLLVEGKLDEQEEIDNFSTWFTKELKAQILLAGPMIVVNVLQYSLYIVSLMFVGHLGKLALASASVATSLATAVGFSVLNGMASCLETLCGQAYGAKQYRLLGVFVQRGLLVLNTISLPISCILLNVGPILRSLGQEPEIAEGAGDYARWLIPSLFAYANLEPLVRFLQSQSEVFSMAVLSTLTLCIHVPLCYFLVIRAGLGLKGAALANGVSQWLNVIFIVLYIKFSQRCNNTWTGFSSEALREMRSFLNLGTPSTVMICLEYWCFELIVLLSGLLPNPELEMSALSVCLNTIVVVYMIPFGLGAAVSTRVSNELGAGRPNAARAAVGLCVSVALVEGVLMGSLLISLRNIWPRAYSDDPEEVTYVSKTAPFLAVLACIDALQGVLCGVARGCGWQLLGAYSNLAAFYVIGLPIAIVLAFKFHLNGIGLCVGLTFGLFTQAIFLSVITCTTNWEQEVKKAVNRVHNNELPIEVTPLLKESDQCEP